MFGARTRDENRRLRDRVLMLEASAGPTDQAPANWNTVRTVTPGADPNSWIWSVTVSRGEAMAVPTLAYIRNQLAGGLSSMPLERYRVNVAEGTISQIAPGWCARPDPAPTIPPSVFWSWVVDDLFFNGLSTLVVLARDSTGYPVAFRRVLPGQLNYDPTTLAWGYRVLNEITYRGVVIDPADVVTIAGPHEGLLNYGAAAIRAALDLEAAAARSAAEPLPNIDLHQTGGEPLSADAATTLVQSWVTWRKAGATGYTPANLEARPLGWSAAELQQVEGRQYVATQLARLAGVNPVLVSAAMGSASSYVYTNQGDYREHFLNDVLDNYLRAIEGRLSAGDVTPNGQYVAFDRDAFTRPTLMERAQLAVAAMRSGATPDQLSQLADALELPIDLEPAAEEASVS